jgi:hypothetical protein
VARSGGLAACVLSLALTLGACEGGISGDAPPGNPAQAGASAAGGGATQPPQEGALSQGPSSALHRLSRREVENTLTQILGLPGFAEQDLPSDLASPFDTDVSSKDASPVFVEGLETLAGDISKRLATDPAKYSALAGCTPASPTDAACLESLIGNLGRRLWRRPLTEAELRPLVISALAFATERQDFALGVRAAASALLQSPSFIYRTEVGAPVASDPTARKLDNYELVSKLSYWLWGSAPDVAQLDRAAGAELDSVALAELAGSMLADPRADKQLVTFHRQWLGFDAMRVSADLAPWMLKETEALLQKVLVDERGAWSQLFRSAQTFVNPPLALHYGLPPVNENDGTWVTYTNPEQVGILAHGSVLSLGARNTDDTSPTIRGKYIATRLMCWTVPPPPPEVNPDDPPQADETTCKAEAYQLHRDSSSSCFACHQMMDPIGFGLERLDGLGRYRTVEKQNPACAISGDGELRGIGTFNGLKALVDLALGSGDVQRCAVRHYFRFSNGRLEQADDEPVLTRLAGDFAAGGEDFRALVQHVISDPAFGYRKEEP